MFHPAPRRDTACRVRVNRNNVGTLRAASAERNQLSKEIHADNRIYYLVNQLSTKPFMKITKRHVSGYNEFTVSKS